MSVVSGDAFPYASTATTFASHSVPDTAVPGLFDAHGRGASGPVTPDIGVGEVNSSTVVLRADRRYDLSVFRATIEK